MRDIETRQDIEKLINRFYGKVRKDEVIGYVFNDVMQVHWETHIPRIIDFWEAVLFRETIFDGNPLEKHLGVDRKEPLERSHFDRWLMLFHQTIDELFQGEKVEEAKYRAVNIADVFLQHIRKGRQTPTFRLDSLSD